MSFGGSMIGILIFYALVAPNSFGRWLADIRAAFDERQRESKP